MASTAVMYSSTLWSSSASASSAYPRRQNSAPSSSSTSSRKHKQSTSCASTTSSHVSNQNESYRFNSSASTASMASTLISIHRATSHHLCQILDTVLRSRVTASSVSLSASQPSPTSTHKPQHSNKRQHNGAAAAICKPSILTGKTTRPDTTPDQVVFTFCEKNRLPSLSLS